MTDADTNFVWMIRALAADLERATTPDQAFAIVREINAECAQRHRLRGKEYVRPQ